MRLLLVGLTSLILAGCNPFVDDQRNLPVFLNKIANPDPSSRNFKSINENHKILVGVLDSGVDYNHPDLKKSMHFDLDQSGNPVGIGWDYLGDDPWASPYLVRTAVYTLPDNNFQKRVSVANHDLIERAIRRDPKLANKISPDRMLEGEIDSNAYHGTHVAGILADKDNLIGIVPYRVLPVPMLFSKNGQLDKNLLNILFQNFLDAHQNAYNRGIRILNVSMVFKRETEQGKIDVDESVFLDLMDQYKSFLDRHPDLLVVVAAGNDHEDLESEKILQMPCGVKHKQILCVGSVNTKNKRSSFSNVFTGFENFVSENGENVWSSYPTNFCDVDFYQRESSFAGFFIPTPQSIFRLLQFDEEYVAKTCGRDKNLHDLRGTSMATPKIAQKAALILLEHPTYGPQQIIEALKVYNPLSVAVNL